MKTPPEVRTLLELLHEVQRGALQGPNRVLFMREQAPGAIPNGARVRKVSSDSGDFHAIGSLAVVVGSFGPMDGEFAYFVLWDDAPNLPVFVRGNKIAPEPTGD